MPNVTDQQQQSTAELVNVIENAIVEDDTNELPIDEDNADELNNSAVILKAVKDVKIYKYSVRSAGLAHRIPKRNLARYLKKINDAIADFAAATDEELLAIISSCTKHHNPLLVSELAANVLLSVCK